MSEDRTKRRAPSDAPSPFSRTPVLVQVAGPGAPRSFPLSNGEYVVGRDVSAPIRIESEDVSRQHAKLIVARGALVSVLDLGSTNGTFLNGHRVELGKVQPGDTIALADARLLLTDADTAAQLLELAGPAAERVAPRQAIDLTERQIDIARLVAAGLTNAAIASRLQISPRTVTSHLDHIYTRLGISSRASLVSALAGAGLLTRSPRGQ